MDQKYIRNFSIIAHIDHGKSTLADRMLEITETVPKRKMKEQMLDSMELERERGITIKMQPVVMRYKKDGTEYILNLIDTPGHIDFSYEVSRALKAVDGSILLVDSTQGVQAQTLSVLTMARELGLTIIPVVSKTDSPQARVSVVKNEVSALLGCSPEDILETSGKTGEGVETLLASIIERIPPPKSELSDNSNFRALVFDFQYSNHRGIIVYIRIFDGVVKTGERMMFSAARESFTALEVGIFSPDETPQKQLAAGEIGYIVTGIKKPDIASVGDTLRKENSSVPALSGYSQPHPVVWAALYPESQDDFPLLRQALERLRLSDAALSFEEEMSGSLGRGFRCGFLGMLHLEIVSERLRREFNLELVVTTPSITYEVVHKNGTKETIYTPVRFPDHNTVEEVREPWVLARIISPSSYLSSIMQLFYEHEGEVGDSEVFGDGRIMISAKMPLRELMRNFFDKLKNISSGFASLSYTLQDMRKADVVRLDMLIADEVVPAFSKVIARRRIEEESKQLVTKLHGALPRQLFTTKIQAKVMGRIVSSKTLSALKKDVTGHLYGGDITRKRKLWEKQKKGKKKMKARGVVNIPQDVFLKMMRPE
ncbi:elongation factor 4 [Patescibacteria group bacterium]|nr:elongation factor 4 [Patescibacteria group bacterium]